MDSNASTTIDLTGKAGGDPTIPQSVSDVREKVRGFNKDGTPRKKYTRQGSADRAASVPAEASRPVGTPGFTEEQITAAFKGLFSVAALSTDCNVWFLADAEAACFVPSATLGLNQAFPSVASSKWGSISLASLALMAVLTSKTLVYLQYKASQKKPVAETVNVAPPLNAA